MNDLAKNLLLWVVVAVVLMVVFQAFGPRTAVSETLAYDQFVQQVQNDPDAVFFYAFVQAHATVY